MSILAVGSVAFDTITTPAGHVDNELGGSATFFSLSASYFTEVRMVAVVGEDFKAEHEAVLQARGVDTRGIEHTSGKTFRWGGRYTFQRSIVTRNCCFSGTFTQHCRLQCAETCPMSN